MFGDPLKKVDANDERYKPALTTAALVGIGLGGSAAFKAMMRHPGWSEKLYNAVTLFEEKSPFKWAKTFGLSEIASAYLPERLTLSKGTLFVGTSLSPMGKHLQRLVGSKYDLKTIGAEGLEFNRTDRGSSFMALKGDGSLKVRFAKKGRLSTSSSILGAPLNPKQFRPPDLSIKTQGPINWFSEFRANTRAWQTSTGYQDVVGKGLVKGLEEGFQPVSAKVEGKSLKFVGQEAERIGFLLTERAQRLLTDTLRGGLPGNSYNRLAHIPFMGGKNVGLLNELLTKRALPFYLAVGVALPFADYLTNHVVSNTALDVIQQTRIAHAKLTDTLPGARKVTDWYERVVPGPQYGPIALPFAGATVGGLYHYGKVLAGKFPNDAARLASSSLLPIEVKDSILGLNRKSPVLWGIAAGIAIALPFLPGMLGSRKSPRELQDIYSGEEPVPIRSGRWWELGTTPWEGNRIKAFRPHWSVLHRTQAEKVSLYGSEEEYWAHHPILHPIKYLKDPYFLEREHYADRPYALSSPAFSNVPLVGPLLAGTIGKLLKPVVRMHPEWTGEEYTLASTRLEPRGPEALDPALPKPEFGFEGVVKREARLFTDLVGLPGFIAQSLWGKAYPDRNIGKEIDYQASRQMENASRRYYEKELGAGALAGGGLEGLSEPLRRFIQPDYQNVPQANQIRNTMPSWLPGEDYFLNFRVGDPYVKIPEGYARLPGKAYETLHPETAGLDPEDYPDVSKMSILADVAPYSVEYRRQESRVRHLAMADTVTEIEYQKITQRVKAMKDSVVRTDDRRFSEEVVSSAATVNKITRAGIELNEFPGRVFNLSSVGYSAADQSAVVLGEHNDWTKTQVANEVENRQGQLAGFFDKYLSSGTQVNIVTAKGALEGSTSIKAVINTDDTNVNKSLITEGLGQYRKDLGGPEAQAMFGAVGRFFGEFAENVAFTGDESRLNPLRYIPTPYHTKYWQERTPLAQYQQQEVEGTRLRRWQHPIADFLMPYVRGTYRRAIGDLGIPSGTKVKWDMNTLTDTLDYVRGLQKAGSDPEFRGKYTSQSSRTAIGSNIFSSPIFLASTFSGRDANYFNRFIKETDPDTREDILNSVPEEMKRALSAQWVKQRADIATAEGQQVPDIGEGGRLYTEEGLEDYSKADTKLNYGDYQRSQEVAAFFSEKKLNLPEDPNSPLYNTFIDYEDVKLKIIQNEGYDMHDFGLFDDRAALLWRKPYVDGAVRELTGSDGRSTEQIRKSVEAMILAAHDKNPQVMLTSNQAEREHSNVRIDVDLDQSKELLKDMRRNPENYQ